MRTIVTILVTEIHCHKFFYFVLCFIEFIDNIQTSCICFIYGVRHLVILLFKPSQVM